MVIVDDEEVWLDSEEDAAEEAEELDEPEALQLLNNKATASTLAKTTFIFFLFSTTISSLKLQYS